MSFTIDTYCEKCGSRLESFTVDDCGLFFVTPCHKECREEQPDLTDDWVNLDYDLLEED